MGLYTRTTRAWLEQRFARRNPTGTYFAHMPVYGLGHPDAEGGHVGRYARLLRLLRALDALPFRSLLDVGGAEGYLVHLARTIWGAETATTDLSHEACLRAQELFGVPAAAVDCARLPFADGAFDVVVCSEVIEHVEHPVETLLELQRVARVAVVLTTEELRYDRASIDDYLFRRPGWPHMERNLFHPDDLMQCVPNAILMPQCDVPPPPEALPREQALAWIAANTTSTTLAEGRIGVIATIPGPAHRSQARRHSDAELLTRLLTTTVLPGTKAAPQPATARATWLSTLRDPYTHGPLRDAGTHLQGSKSYALREGVPDFVDVESPPMPRADLARRIAALPQNQQTALLKLRDRLFLPDRWPQDFFDLTQREHRRGFWPNDHLVVRGEGFCWRAIGNDPWVVTPCLQRAVNELEVTMRITAPDVPIDAGTGQVFWKGAADDSFAEERSVKFPLCSDGSVRTYRIVLAGHPLLPSEVQWLRLDPADGACDIDLLSLRLR